MPIISICISEIRTQKSEREKWFQRANVEENLLPKISTYIWKFGGTEDPIGSSQFKVVAPSLEPITRELKKKYGIEFSEAKKWEGG